jgi:hypothetical protein
MNHLSIYRLGYSDISHWSSSQECCGFYSDVSYRFQYERKSFYHSYLAIQGNCSGENRYNFIHVKNFHKQDH